MDPNLDVCESIRFMQTASSITVSSLDVVSCRYRSHPSLPILDTHVCSLTHDHRPPISSTNHSLPPSPSLSLLSHLAPSLGVKASPLSSCHSKEPVMPPYKPLPSLFPKLDSLLESWTTTSEDDQIQPRLPGTFVSLTSSSTYDSPIYLKAKGQRQLGSASSDQRGPVTTGTLLYIASCTKLVTTLSILHLIDSKLVEGLNIDSKVETWLPELARGKVKVLKGFRPQQGDRKPEPILQDLEQGKEITIGQLLDHSSGFAYAFKNPDYLQYYIDNGFPIELTLDKKSTLHNILVQQPGTDFVYGQGIDWVGLLVERISGKSLLDFMRENLFQPLGMKSTSFYACDVAKSSSGATQLPDCDNGMTLHWRSGEVEEATEVVSGQGSKGKKQASLSRIEGQLPTMDMSVDKGRQVVGLEVGGAGLISTIEDYTKLLSYVLRLYKVHSGQGLGQEVMQAPGKLLSKETCSHLFNPRHFLPGVARLAEEEGHLPTVEEGHKGLGYTAGQGYIGGGGVRDAWSQGTIYWGGVTNLSYYLDGENDLAYMTATQILPFPDLPFRDFNHELIKT
ncbi:beta-lactamase/transpeptidase-like protein, partial [Violaceomyces palustris]